MIQLSTLIRGAVATTVSNLATGATLNTPASGNFSIGTFTWPTFNQNTLGTAASLSAILPLTLGGTGSDNPAGARLALGAAPTANPTFTGTVTIPSGTTISGLLGSASNSVTALGSTQASAAALVSDVNVITLAAAGTGVSLPNAAPGKYVVVVNRSANAVNIYPATGHAFDGLSANIPISVLPYAFIELFASSTTQWYSSYQALTLGQFVVGDIPGNAAGLTATLSVGSGGTGVTTSTGSGSVVLSTSPTLVTPVLGIPTSVTLTNATGLPLTTGVTGILPSANGGTGVTTSTGSGANVLATSPTLVTPVLGTPTSGNFSTGTFTWPTFNQNTTGTAASLSVALSVTLGGTGATAITGSGNNVLSISPTLVTPILGTPTSVTLTNATGLPVATGISGLGTGVATALALATNTAGAFNTIDGVATLSNKRITARVWLQSVNATTYAIDTDSYDMVYITSQSATITSITTIGTPTNGQKLWISITGSTTVGFTLSSSNFEASTISLPAATSGSIRLDMGFVWGGSKWRCVAVA